MVGQFQLLNAALPSLDTLFWVQSMHFFLTCPFTFTTAESLPNWFEDVCTWGFCTYSQGRATSSTPSPGPWACEGSQRCSVLTHNKCWALHHLRAKLDLNFLHLANNARQARRGIPDVGGHFLQSVGMEIVSAPNVERSKNSWCRTIRDWNSTNWTKEHQRLVHALKCPQACGLSGSLKEMKIPGILQSTWTVSQARREGCSLPAVSATHSPLFQSYP